LKALPYREPHQLVAISSFPRQSPKLLANLSFPDIADIREHSRTFAAIGYYKQGSGVALSSDTQFENVNAVHTGGEFFRVLGTAALLGRSLEPADNDPGQNKVVVLGFPLWRSHFGSDPAVIGRNVLLNNTPYTIVGVMPSNFWFPDPNVQIWLPDSLSSDVVGDRGLRDKSTIARLQQGVALKQAQAELELLAARTGLQFTSDRQSGFAVRSVEEQFVGPVRPTLLYLLGAVGMVLLITCANVASLFLVRNAARQRQTAVRIVLGAARGHLFQQFLFESMVVALPGGFAGMLLAAWGAQTVRTLGSVYIPRLGQVGMDWLVAGFVLGVSVVTGVLFGFIPGFLSFDADIIHSPRQASPTRLTRFSFFHGQRLQGFFVASQIALALMLIIVAGLTVRSLQRLTSVDLGFKPRNLHVFLLSPRWGDQTPHFFFRRVLTEIESLPNVTQAALLSPTPLRGRSFAISFGVESNRGWVMGSSITFQIVSPGYFQTVGIPLLKGRTFSDHDFAATQCVVIANQLLAEGYWGDQEPVGKRINLNGLDLRNPYYCQVVGVAANSRQISLQAAPVPLIYFFDLQRPQRTRSLIVRSTEESSFLAYSVLKRIHLLDHNQQLGTAISMAGLIDRSIAGPRFRASVVTAFGFVSLLLAGAGVYGLTSYSVHRRSHEIGVRLALGAQPNDVVRMVLRSSVTLALIGIALGACSAFAATRLLESLLFEIRPGDPASFASAGAIVFLASVLASYLPSRRAAKIDPTVLLRSE
jgi:putative ABC transport system permease protein